MKLKKKITVQIYKDGETEPTYKYKARSWTDAMLLVGTEFQQENYGISKTSQIIISFK
jgi:hypothetical protein